MSILNLFEVARRHQAAVAAPTPAAIKCGRSASERDAVNARYPQSPAKASYKERLAKLNQEAQEKARVERLARIKAARLARREAAMRKQALEILRFGGKVIFSLPSQILREAMAQAKQAGHVAFVRVVQEYALGCLEVGFEFDVKCESWIARQAHKAALAAERQAIKEALRELLRGYFEEAGVTVYASRAAQVANESIQTREVAAQSVKHAGREAHLEVASARHGAEGTLFGSYLLDLTVKSDVVETEVVEIPEEEVEVDPEAPAEESREREVDVKVKAYSRMRRNAKRHLTRLPEGKSNDADAYRKEKAQAVLAYYQTLVETAKSEMTKEEIKAANKAAMVELVKVTKSCKAKLSTFRKGHKRASTAKSESKKGKSNK